MSIEVPLFQEIFTCLEKFLFGPLEVHFTLSVCLPPPQVQAPFHHILEIYEVIWFAWIPIAQIHYNIKAVNCKVVFLLSYVLSNLRHVFSYSLFF